MGRGFGDECTLLTGADVLGMLHLNEEEFEVASWTCPCRERGNLFCNLTSRLCDYLKSVGGGDHKALVLWDMLVQSREEAAPIPASLRMRFSGFGYIPTSLLLQTGSPSYRAFWPHNFIPSTLMLFISNLL